MRGSWLTHALLLSLTLSMSSVAGAHDDDALGECRRIADDAERLACYDATAPTAARPTAIPTPPPAADPPGRNDTPAPSRPAAVGAESPRAAPEWPVAAVDDVEAVPRPAPAGRAEASAPVAGTSPAVPGPAPVAPAASAAASPDDDFGRELLERGEDEPEMLVSRIDGDYEGWFGNTVFRLQNGQVWVQAQAGKSRYKGPPNPQVTIERRVFGSYRLQVEGSNRTVRVKRLE